MRRKLNLRLTEWDGVQALRGKFTLLGNPFTFCSYVVDHVMIDTGPIFARKEIFQFATDFQVEKIVLTHHHEDHSGNAFSLSRHGFGPVFMTQQIKKQMEHFHVPLYRQLVWGNKGNIKGSVQEKILDDQLTTKNYNFRVIQTPGHTDDHICLVEVEQGWAFTGDLYLGNKLHYGMKGESVAQLINSLKAVLSFPIRTVFCGHAGVIENGREALEKKLDFLEWLTVETKERWEKGQDASEIAKELLPRQHLIPFFSQGEMSPIHLIHSVIHENE